MRLTDEQLKALAEAIGFDWNHVRANRIFCPHFTERTVDLVLSKTQLAHYTTTENALKILEGRTVWLRNVRCMNDYSEVQWGNRLVASFFFERKDADPFWKTLEGIVPGIRQRTTELYRDWVWDFVSNTYVFCVSEHKPSDDMGRLSMWRAYASNNGCALIFDSAPFYQPTDALGSYTYPVCYRSPDTAFKMFQSIVESVCENEAFLKTLPPDDLQNYVFTMLEYHAICVKHPAFAEELEWRVVHRPFRFPNDRMQPTIRPIRGLVQRIYQLPLKNIPDENLKGIEPHEIVRKILLGPAVNSAVAHDAAIQKLRDLGFSNPEAIVIDTRIPLRTEPA